MANVFAYWAEIICTFGKRKRPFKHTKESAAQDVSLEESLPVMKDTK